MTDTTTENHQTAGGAAPDPNGAALDAARDRLQRLHDLYAFGHLTVDFLAGLTFTVGSVLFFWPRTEVPAIWLFVVGSVLFTAKPSVRLAHMLHDGHTRRSLERALSEEARVALTAFTPRGRTLRI
ncbi:YrhK family protein [Rhodospira trueperi]|uniref:YrhK-like protein n=1 Tax=Rhodospira trueperi TaxID=69960 RepID=A0A1G7A1T1_9PROT|nr:YrhK family protein [Rhodospira trueperi]SDE08477.1 YrhK-like protein [Rhodospira trueperi]